MDKLISTTKTKWNDQAQQKLVRLYPTTPVKQISIMIGISEKSIRIKAKRLKLKKIIKDYQFAITPMDEEFLKINYKSMTALELGAALGYTRSKIKNHLNRLGLRLSEEERLGRCSRGFFIKGATPANKGKRIEEFMSPEAVKKFRSNQFKKGNQPHNTKTDGEISQRNDKRGVPYLFIRISDKNWIHLQRHNWEKLNGKIPKDQRLHCKDGNTLNCDPSNWEVLTPQEAIDRNRLSNYPKELQDVIRLKNKLIKKTNNGKKQDK